MKKILSILIIGIILTNCQKENRTDYVINGKADGVYNGIRVYLKQRDDKGREIAIDTSIVMNERFTMDGQVEAPSIHSIHVDGITGSLDFMLENSEIDIDVNKQNIKETKISGSESNKDYLTFKNGITELRDKGQNTITLMKQMQLSGKVEKSDSLTKELEKLRSLLNNYPLNFIKENKDSYFSLNLIQLESNRPNFDINNYKEAFDNISSELKNSKKGQMVKQKLDKLYEEYEKIAHLEVGKIAPSFEAPTPNGEMLSLDTIKGKVTIIDFWAAWCGPCRRENPNVVKIYETYHDQGLEIIGVSLDGQNRQQNPKKAWLDAIEKDGLTWHQVSNLKYFNDPVAKLYNIQSIPATFILDEDGKIVAKNLRGIALENKVKELLDKS